jgi:hypothetical protein
MQTPLAPRKKLPPGGTSRRGCGRARLNGPNERLELRPAYWTKPSEANREAL